MMDFERPDFQRMIDLVRDGQIQVMIVKELSRFGRDYLEVGDYLEHIFPFLGVRMISINDHCMEKNVFAIIKRMERDLYFFCVSLGKMRYKFLKIMFAFLVHGNI